MCPRSPGSSSSLPASQAPPCQTTTARTLQLGYALGNAILVASLLLILVGCRVIEGSLSVTRIHTRPGEVFQLGAILIRNAPCTPLFDPLADDSGLGFEGGAGLIGGIIVLMRPRNHIGLNSGTSGPSLVLAGILVILVARATWRQRRAARA